MQARSNPTGAYAPSLAACPSVASLIRSAQSEVLCSNETDYIQRHQSATQQAWTDWLRASNPGPNLDGVLPGGAQTYTSNLDALPRVGVALSGGGYRAMVSDTGSMAFACGG